VLQDKRDTYYKQSKTQEKKEKKKDKYLISIDQILLMKNFKSCSGVNQFYV